MHDKDKKIVGLPDDLKITRRPYTMTPAAVEARRLNAMRSTGPVTEDGKKASSRNAWKHGLYASTFILGTLGRPCQTTCDKYPCTLVDDSQVHPGETCLDKQFVAEAFDSIMTAVEHKNRDEFNHLAALELAGAIQILRQMKEAILEDGVIVKSEKMDKDGNSLGYEYKGHPALAIYTKMIVDLGFTPQELLLTPKEISKAERSLDEDDKDNVADIMSRAFKNLAGKRDAN